MHDRNYTSSEMGCHHSEHTMTKHGHARRKTKCSHKEAVQLSTPNEN